MGRHLPLVSLSAGCHPAAPLPPPLTSRGLWARKPPSHSRPCHVHSQREEWPVKELDGRTVSRVRAFTPVAAGRAPALPQLRAAFWAVNVATRVVEGSSRMLEREFFVDPPVFRSLSVHGVCSSVSPDSETAERSTRKPPQGRPRAASPHGLGVVPLVDCVRRAHWPSRGGRDGREEGRFCFLVGLAFEDRNPRETQRLCPSRDASRTSEACPSGAVKVPSPVPSARREHLGPAEAAARKGQRSQRVVQGRAQSPSRAAGGQERRPEQEAGPQERSVPARVPRRVPPRDRDARAEAREARGWKEGLAPSPSVNEVAVGPHALTPYTSPCDGDAGAALPAPFLFPRKG